ncbi:MAG: thiamine diphosphokinase [Clostridia bacterium]|nr:thiamine diphosphokinase [Clostridia bacterium]
MARAVIISALPTRKPIEILPSDFVIACDMGYKRAKEAGIKPDLVIGDFDSLQFTPDFQNIIKLPVKKDDTDTGYAINYAIDKGYRDIAVYGALGGLIDHTIASVQLAAGASKKGINITFFEDKSALYAVTNGKLTLNCNNKRFSVFAIDECSGVTIKNAEFCLFDGTLTPFMPLGVSNKQKDNTEIEVQNGTIVVLSYI